MKVKIFIPQLVLGILLSLNSCVDLPKATQTSFETMKIEAQDYVATSKISTTLSGKNDVNITPRITGQLLSKLVKSGDKVKAGQVLFQIDSRSAKLELDNALANLQAAEAQLNTAQLEYESNKNLFEKKIVSSYMLNSAKNDFERAKAAVAQAKAAVAYARLNLNYCTITSPVTGIVGDLPISEGTQVSPSDILATVSSNSDITAKISITENELAAINKEYGSIDEKLIKNFPPVSLMLKNGDEYMHKGVLKNVSGMVDKTTGSVAVSFSFPNPEGQLYSGMQGSVLIPYTYENAIVIPETAVVRLQDKMIVYTVGKDNCANSVIITAEESGDGKNVIVLSGLKVGDVIVKVGAANVRNKQQVIFPEEKAEKK